MDATTRRFVISLAACAMSGALLILLVPSLFESPGEVRLGIVAAVAIVTVAFGLTTRRWRRNVPGSGSR